MGVANYAAWISIAIFFGIASSINPGVSFNKRTKNIKRIKAIIDVKLGGNRNRTSDDFIYIRNKVFEIFEIREKNLIEYYL